MQLSSLAATVYKLVLTFSFLSTSAVSEVVLQQSLHVFITTRRMLILTKKTVQLCKMLLILSDALLQQSFDHEKS